MKLVRKDNHSVEMTGTLENLSACAAVNGFYRADDGSIGIDYEGTTEVFWDGQVTVQREGQTVYLDEGGNEYLESECELIDDQQGE